MEKIKKELDLSISDEEKDIAYVNKLNRTKDKIKYLRFVKGYTQIKAAKMIGISERHVKRLEKELRMSP
ncbi:sigma factor-like helix-turn-helix DNA-binding protein [Clostridium beijerinckii]|uniref:sigma factor-like helix-turn-helix DNA-binding protein n=1 Tax=Clostridium beijerinckii TaxID=1520 RepID=UPI001F4C3C9C|nr:sigma factor-like helix-turn-helix DNA-binding protein [Clostridium beijerinckii]NRT76321.1 DNA-directed RNA polymerase specialized sigma subunit [Clostridium beijerinckii]